MHSKLVNIPQKEMDNSATNLRIGQLIRKKDYEDHFDDNYEWSESGEISEEALEIGPDTPWYLKGTQVKVIEFIYFSEKDESTASEGDVLGDTDDDFSTIDDSDIEMLSSSSSDDDEADGEKGKADPMDEEEEESSDSKGDSATSTTQSTAEGSVKSHSSKSDSRSNPSETDSVVYATESTKMLVNKKLAVSSDEKKRAELNYNKAHFKLDAPEDSATFDLTRANEIQEQLIGQKVALFEKDMSDYLTGKKKEEAMSETIRGATYWRIRKSIKVLKGGDEFATYHALRILDDCELENPENHSAIEDTGSLEVFVNLLNVDSTLCRVGTLSVLDKLTELSEGMIEMSMNLGMVEELYRILLSNNDQEVIIAIRCICNLVSNKRARTIIRKAGLVPILFYMVHRVPLKFLRSKLSEVFDEVTHRQYEIALGALYILTNIMRSKQVREDLYHYGYVSIIIPLLASRERLVVKAILEGILLCASLKIYRERFEIAGLIKIILKHWKKYEELVLRFVYKMSIGVIARDQIIESQALNKMAKFVMNMDNIRKDPYGFKYALSTLYRMGAHHNFRDIFHQLNLLEPLIKILKNDPPDSYKLNITSVLATMSVYSENWKPIVELGGLQCVLDIIFTHIADMWLLANCLKILGDVAHSDDARNVLLEQPGTLSFLLSMLQDGRPMITRCTASAIIPLTRVYIDFAEIMKSEAECLEHLMYQLEPSPKGMDNTIIQSVVCEALAAITCDSSILQILSGLGLIKKIPILINTENEALQESVCLLISMCAIFDESRTEMGTLGILERLANLLTSSNIHVVIAAADALWKLSFDAANATHLLTANISEQLLQWSMSEYEELSEASLGVLKNIRFAATSIEAASNSGPHWVITAPEWTFPYHFKPHVFFHDEIELT